MKVIKAENSKIKADFCPQLTENKVNNKLNKALSILKKILVAILITIFSFLIVTIFFFYKIASYIAEGFRYIIELIT